MAVHLYLQLPSRILLAGLPILSELKGTNITLATSPTPLYPTESREKINKPRAGKLSSPQGKISTSDSEPHVLSLNMCGVLGSLLKELHGHLPMAPSHLNCRAMPSAHAGPNQHPFLHSCFLPL